MSSVNSFSRRFGFDGLLQLGRRIGGPAGPVVNRCALIIEKYTKEQLSHAGGGRTYPARKGRGAHQASAPGESPAPDLGDLRKSIGREQVGDVMRVGTGLRRAAALEFGHVYQTGGGTMFRAALENRVLAGIRVLAPRPFMRPALQRALADQELKGSGLVKALAGDLEIRGVPTGSRGD